MARHRGMSLRPVHRIKHVVDQQGGLVIGTVSDNVLIEAKDAPVLANTKEVETGSKVNAIYLKVEVNAVTSAALANVYMSVYKNQGGNITAPTPNIVGSSDNKRFVIHQEMVMMQKNQNIGASELGGNPRTLFNGVIVIPRGYRRFGPSDLLNITFLSPGVTVDFCLQCHYKEFR